MKPYIIDDRNIFLAEIVPIVLCIGLFSIYMTMLEYKGLVVTIILGVMTAKIVISNIIVSIRHLRRYLMTKKPHMRIDNEGIFIDINDMCETVRWEQVKEIDICRYKESREIKDLCLYIYLEDCHIIFGLERYLDGINLFALRRACRHFSNRPGIVKKRSLIII